MISGDMFMFMFNCFPIAKVRELKLVQSIQYYQGYSRRVRATGSDFNVSESSFKINNGVNTFNFA